MISRLLKFSALCAVLFPSAFAQEEAAQPVTQEVTQEGDKNPAPGGFQWVRSDSPLTGQKLAKNQLNRLPRYAEHAPWQDTEEETVQVDERTVRRTLRVYRENAQRKRELAEVVEEEIRTGEDGTVKAVRTVSANDVNGKLQVIRRETQETVPEGSDAFRTQTTVELQGPNQKLRPVERLETIERQVDDQTAQFERMRSVVDVNGNWELAERREANLSEVSGVIYTEEKVFRPDGTRQMTLSEQVTSTEWLHDDGARYRSIETRQPNFDGKMEMVQQVATVRRDLEGGGEQTVEEVSTRPLGAPDTELKLVERVTQETSEAAGSRTLWIEGLDLRGRLAVMTSFTTSTKEGPEGKKTSKTVSNN